MRTACLVIAILLFSVVLGFPQGRKTSRAGPSCGLEQEITVPGNDATAVPVTQLLLIGPTNILDPGRQMPTVTPRTLVRPSCEELAVPEKEWRSRNAALANAMLLSDFQSSLSENLQRLAQFARQRRGPRVLVPRIMRLEIIKRSGYTDIDAGVEPALRALLFSQADGRKDEVATMTYRFRLEKQD
jgi:hypothetical protein